jgi:tripartite-type tricarboxylate transporter receptor subunit TctC
MRLPYVLSVFIAVLLSSVAHLAAAQTAAPYPAKTIRLIVPFTPGGGNDISARFIAQRLTEAFGHSVIVENRPGAGSTVGSDLVAKAAPDGYTLMVIHNAIAINQTLYPKLPYDAVRDFAQVALVGVTTNTLVVHPALPVKSTRDLIALAKAKPGSLNYASTGAGGTSHLAMEYFRLSTDTAIVHIPYKGTAPALTDMVAGQTQVMISALPGTMPFINAKRLTALATSGKKRSVFLPNLPTLAEAGVKDYEFDTWYGMHAPVKVPRDIIEKLNGAIVKALAMPDVKQQLANQGIEAGSATPEEFTRFVRAEIEKMGRIIKASGARPE